MEWDELRFFHAVAVAGSLSKAARDLGVSQPTVGRRIKALEDRLDAQLFDKLISGHVLTETGIQVFEKTGEIAEIARCIADRAEGERKCIAGPVTLTAPEGIGATWLPTQLLDMSEIHPDLDLRVSLSNRISDVSNGEADVALRMGDPRDETLIGRKIAALPFRLFASPCYINKYGAPADLDALRHHRIIDSGGIIRDVAQARLLREIAHSARVAATLDGVMAQKAAARAGVGLVALPPYLTYQDPDLLPVLEDAFLVKVPVWLLTRQDLRGSRRIGAVKTFLTQAARQFS
ncbi:MAG: LysR family transcriptional regulator [Pseudomonadota bacterium]